MTVPQTLDLTQTITVAQGESLSAAVDLGAATLIGLDHPAAIEATTTNISFWCAPTLGGTYKQVAVGGTLLSLPMAVSTWGMLSNIGQLYGVRYLKIRCETAAGAAVAQATSARVFGLIKKPLG
jgi:hypothetical protein